MNLTSVFLRSAGCIMGTNHAKTASLSTGSACPRRPTTVRSSYRNSSPLFRRWCTFQPLLASGSCVICAKSRASRCPMGCSTQPLGAAPVVRICRKNILKPNRCTTCFRASRGLPKWNCDPPDFLTLKSRCAPPLGKSTICSRKSTLVSNGGSAHWSP